MVIALKRRDIVIDDRGIVGARAKDEYPRFGANLA
jgi:hypothetical protein